MDGKKITYTLNKDYESQFYSDRIMENIEIIAYKNQESKYRVSNFYHLPNHLYKKLVFINCKSIFIESALEKIQTKARIETFKKYEEHYTTGAKFGFCSDFSEHMNNQNLFKFFSNLKSLSINSGDKESEIILKLIVLRFKNIIKLKLGHVGYDDFCMHFMENLKYLSIKLYTGAQLKENNLIFNYPNLKFRIKSLKPNADEKKSRYGEFLKKKNLTVHEELFESNIPFNEPKYLEDYYNEILKENNENYDSQDLGRYFSSLQANETMSFVKMLILNENEITSLRIFAKKNNEALKLRTVEVETIVLNLKKKSYNEEYLKIIADFMNTTLKPTYYEIQNICDIEILKICLKYFGKHLKRIWFFVLYVNEDIIKYQSLSNDSMHFRFIISIYQDNGNDVSSNLVKCLKTLTFLDNILKLKQHLGFNNQFHFFFLESLETKILTSFNEIIKVEKEEEKQESADHDENITNLNRLFEGLIKEFHYLKFRKIDVWEILNKLMEDYSFLSFRTVQKFDFGNEFSEQEKHLANNLIGKLLSKNKDMGR